MEMVLWQKMRVQKLQLEMVLWQRRLQEQSNLELERALGQENLEKHHLLDLLLGQASLERKKKRLEKMLEITQLPQVQAVLGQLRYWAHCQAWASW